ncbi:MAG: ATP-binding cassette domain-containing protein [Xanthomonadaceae bacterium]|jgi:ATP-binding cassette subfamily B protein|nr:ATP-binding cassette domain-containing protein [Xanthomonadaceae bacterium]
MNTPHLEQQSRLHKLGSLRTLWPFIRRHARLLVAWLIALAVSSTATLSLPVAFRQMIDHGFSGMAADAGQINRAFMLLFAVALVLAIATALRFYFVSLLGEKVVADLRDRLYSHLISLDLAFHDHTRSGELVSRLSADSELLRSVIGTSMSVALRSSVTVIGSVIMLFVTSPHLAIYSLVGIPLSVLPIIFGARRLRRVARDSQDRVADANTIASETLGAVRTVQAHGRQDYEQKRFGAALRVSIAAAQRRIRTQSLVTASAITLVFGAIVLVLWLGAHDVIAGRMTTGELGQFVLYALIGGGSIGGLAEVWNDLQRASGGMGRVSELLQETSAILPPEDPHVFSQSFQGEIAFRNVFFHYRGRAGVPALEDFTLHVAAGETVALVGPSGAGKSTVFSLLLRFYDPQAGTIHLDGIDIRELEPNQMRERIALVPQQPTLFATTVADNIRYGRLDADDNAIVDAARAANANGFIGELPDGYASELGERGARLSGGQQQRIAIARALLKNAPILLLDEATSALDAQSESAVQEALENLIHGRTTLVIAHRLATVLKADRIVVMDKGRVVAEGSHAQLIAQNGLYAELARLQFLE